MLDKTLLITVTCSREPTRHRVLEKSIQNLVENFPDHVLGDLIVFDNNSTKPSRDLLKQSFEKVYCCNTNVGYWTALDWLLRHHQKINGRTYDYVHVIESDQLYFDVGKFDLIEQFLDENLDIGGMKCHEYSVAERHLYDKGNHYPESKRWDWIQHFNPITGQSVKLEQVEGYDDLIYQSNFAIQVTNVLRLKPLAESFNELSKEFPDGFSEHHLRAEFYKKFPIIGVLDGGLHSKKESHFEYVDVITGSHTAPEILEQHGYRKSAIDKIFKECEYIVTPPT